MSPTSQPDAKLWTAQSCAPSWSDCAICSCSSGGSAGGREREHVAHDLGRVAGVVHERLGEDGDVVAEDGGDLVRVAGAADVAQQRDPVDGRRAASASKPASSDQPCGEEARPQLRLERLAERVVLRERERRDELAQAERRVGNGETSRCADQSPDPTVLGNGSLEPPTTRRTPWPRSLPHRRHPTSATRSTSCAGRSARRPARPSTRRRRRASSTSSASGRRRRASRSTSSSCGWATGAGTR